MMARAATPPTAPPTIAPMLVELLLLVVVLGLAVPVPVPDDLVVVVVVLVEVELLDDDSVLLELVLVSESSTALGWSIMEMMVGSGKHRYMDFCGLPGHKKVPHAPHEESVLESLGIHVSTQLLFPSFGWQRLAGESEISSD